MNSLTGEVVKEITVDVVVVDTGLLGEGLGSLIGSMIGSNEIGESDGGFED